MNALRRGVGSDSSNVQTERGPGTPTSGRLSPRTTSATRSASVKSAATSRIQRGCGSATTAISAGDSRDASHSMKAVITTTNSPSVENSHRPNSATRAGRTTRLTRAKTTPQTK